MSKLVSAEFYKLRGKFVKMLIITIAFSVIGAFLSMSISGTVYHNLSTYAAVFASIFCGVTGVIISQDFAHNTIRNKLIVGHTRLSIYLSYQITFALLAFLLTIVFIGAHILSGKLFSCIEVFRTDQPAPDVLKVYSENFLKALPVYLAAVPALTALGVFISMTTKNGSAGILNVILVYALIFLLSLDENSSGNKFLEYVNQFVPSSQIFLMESISSESDFSPLKYIVFSLAFAIVLLCLGYAIFRKADLK